jgi:hypothetical protein
VLAFFRSTVLTQLFGYKGITVRRNTLFPKVADHPDNEKRQKECNRSVDKYRPVNHSGNPNELLSLTSSISNPKFQLKFAHF